MFGKLSPAEIEEVLKRQFIGHIGCHVDDITYVVPISYAYDGVYIYGHTFEGMKVNMMRKNPKVCFQVDTMRNMANWKSVISWGEYEELKEKEERNHALQQLIDRTLPVITSKTVQLTPQWPFPSKDTESIKGIVYRIRLREKTGRFENNSETFGIA
jgi:nitroimidazol reductase NimA-like FMN-containing flavoprotein (pyridoxamine 5'-phosphate oxidase superfamily)